MEDFKSDAYRIYASGERKKNERGLRLILDKDEMKCVLGYEATVVYNFFW